MKRLVWLMTVCLALYGCRHAQIIQDTTALPDAAALCANCNAPAPENLFQNECVDSPAGRYAITYRKPATADNELGIVCLFDKKTNHNRGLFGYTRDVNVQWSPGGDRFAVNDYYASNASTCRIFSMDHLAHPVDIEELMKRAEQERPGSFGFAQNDKRYMQAVRWVSNTRITLMVWGWGEWNPSGYRAFMDYVVGKGFENVRVHNGWN